MDKIQLLDNYSLFFSLYEESYKIKNIYQNHRNNFDDSKFDEENKKYFEDNFEKIEFLYNNIIPTNDFTIRPNTSIIKKLIELIDNLNIGLNEIIQYYLIQNINIQIKLIEFSIINNILLYINDGLNINLLLNFVNKKMRHGSNELNSIFDNIYGTDYFFVEKLKYQFQLFLNIVSHKIINNKKFNYSALTQEIH